MLHTYHKQVDLDTGCVLTVNKYLQQLKENVLKYNVLTLKYFVMRALYVHCKVRVHTQVILCVCESELIPMSHRMSSWCISNLSTARYVSSNL